MVTVLLFDAIVTPDCDLIFTNLASESPLVLILSITYTIFIPLLNKSSYEIRLSQYVLNASHRDTRIVQRPLLSDRSERKHVRGYVVLSQELFVANHPVL
jgi:hypothetical protein